MKIISHRCNLIESNPDKENSSNSKLSIVPLILIEDINLYLRIKNLNETC